MKETRLPTPELALIAVTRAVLGAGIALLVADRLDDRQRRAIGWTLLSLGAISTVPLAADVIRRNRPTRFDNLAQRSASPT